MTSQTFDPADLGWTSFFASQLTTEDRDLIPARVTAVHRSAIQVLGPDVDAAIPPFHGDAEDPSGESAATIGDWLLLERIGADFRAHRLLERRSLFKRKAAGESRRVQLVAANVDTVFVVTSCNRDFNVARLERYLALAREAEVAPVVVVTKADLADAPQDYAREAARLLPGLFSEAIDARDPAQVARLAPWCGRGQTVAVMGSSGVGKSTLINTLTGAAAATNAVREDDDRGRHTTTGRSLHRLPAGGWLIDTPGMREIQLADASDGIDAVFADVAGLAGRCRFSDCAHETEPDCAIRAAIEAGALEPDRVRRWRKLVAEEARNTRSLAESRARERNFGRHAKQVMKAKRSRKDPGGGG